MARRDVPQLAVAAFLNGERRAVERELKVAHIVAVADCFAGKQRRFGGTGLFRVPEPDSGLRGIRAVITTAKLSGDPLAIGGNRQLAGGSSGRRKERRLQRSVRAVQGDRLGIRGDGHVIEIRSQRGRTQATGFANPPADEHVPGFNLPVSGSDSRPGGVATVLADSGNRFSVVGPTDGENGIAGQR